MLDDIISFIENNERYKIIPFIDNWILNYKPITTNNNFFSFRYKGNVYTCSKGKSYKTYFKDSIKQKDTFFVLLKK